MPREIDPALWSSAGLQKLAELITETLESGEWDSQNEFARFEPSMSAGTVGKLQMNTAGLVVQYPTQETLYKLSKRLKKPNGYSYTAKELHDICKGYIAELEGDTLEAHVDRFLEQNELTLDSIAAGMDMSVAELRKFIQAPEKVAQGKRALLVICLGSVIGNSLYLGKLAGLKLPG